jgi:hypothetical protein
MTRYLLALSLIFCSSFALAGELDKEIRNWRPGQEVPQRLLSYPDGAVEPRHPECYFGTNEAAIAGYIGEIENDALLEEIVFDPRSESASFEHALMRLVERKGLKPVARILLTRESTRWEHEALRQLLLVRYANLAVASISTKDMSREKALSALDSLKRALERGQTWKAAYAAVADANPDIERRKREPKVPTTLVRYLFSGWVSEDGYVFSQLGVNAYLPAKYLHRIVNSGKGAQLIEDSDEIYLYYVSDVYEPGA